MGLGSILFSSAPVPICDEKVRKDGVEEGNTPLGSARILKGLLGNKEDRKLFLDQVGVPKLREGKIRQAVSVVPLENWTLVC